MPIRPVVVGLAAGAVLAAGGISALDLATTSADAQGGGPVSQAQFDQLEARVAGVGQNSSAAQRISKNLQNVLGKHVDPEGTLIGAKEPPGVIRQDRGLGDGLPEDVLSAEVRAKLDAGGPQGPPGATGAQGEPGPAGPRGPSEAWYRQRTSDFIPMVTPGDVLVLDIPAGTFVVNATVLTVGSAAPPATHSVSCEIRVVPTTGSIQTGGGIMYSAPNPYESAATAFGFTTATSAQAALSCSSTTAGTEIIHATLLATRVGDLTVQPNM